MNNRSETFNGVDPCLFSSFKEKVNIKINLATPSFKNGGAFSPLSSEPLNTKNMYEHNQVQPKKLKNILMIINEEPRHEMSKRR
jgi:hypothetical protein